MAMSFEKRLGKLKPEEVKKVAVIQDKPAKQFLRLATSLASLREKTTAKLHKVVTDAGGKMLDSAPLAIPSRNNPNEVTIFPNIKAKASVESVAEFLIEILNNPKMEVKLQTAERCVKMALKREKTTLAKLFTAHSNLPEKMRADQIEGVSNQAVLAFQKSRIVECKTPMDCYIAYSTDVGGSCMKKGSTYYGDWTSKTWVQIAEDTGFYPSAWYLFQPYAKLCYLEVGGVPVCRFMLYREDCTKDVWPFYGDVKQSTPAYGKAVTDEMVKQGKKLKGSTDTVVPYEVPALFHSALKGGKTPHCPLPFADSQRRDFSVWYDADRKVFLFDQTARKKGGLVINDNYAHKGYIDGSKVPLLPAAPKPEAAVAEVAVAVAEEVVPEKLAIPKPERAVEDFPAAKQRTCKTCNNEKGSAKCAECNTDRYDSEYHDNWQKIATQEVEQVKEFAPKKKVPAMGGAAEVAPVREAKVKAPAVGPKLPVSDAHSQWIVDVG